MSMRLKFGTIPVALLIACCNPSPLPSESLVGAQKLPSASDLQKETLIIARMGGEDGEELLNVKLRPDNTVLVEHSRRGDDRPLEQELLRPSAQAAEEVRHMLWRLRPEDSAPAQKTVPLGCSYVYDAGWDWSVVFWNPRKPAELPTFTLPYPEYCQPAAYKKARELIVDSLSALPSSEVVKHFPSGRLHPTGTYSP
jgi:hypothetical protein